MTNILRLPQLAATFTIANNADWRDQILFTQQDGVTPLDLTGISFAGALRSATSDPNLPLSYSTGAGTLINGGTSGLLTWAVPKLLTSTLKLASYVTDLLALGDGVTINLFTKSGPAPVNVNQGVTPWQ